MKILFCNIAWMNFYKGNINGNDEPQGGGSYVAENKDAHEKYNFESIPLSELSGYPKGNYCLGFVETKTTNGKTRNQLNIEKIDGCELCKNESQVEDVLVIYCAKYPDSCKNETYVVGWYKHAIVYRYYETMQFPSVNGEDYYQSYNAIAETSNCTLLPRGKRRNENIWRVPRKKGGISYGFGQANVWFASEFNSNENLKNFLDRIVRQINEYDGDNWVDKYED